MITRIIGAIGLCAILVGVPASVGWPQEWRTLHVVITMGAQSWRYDSDQLRAMATKRHVSMRGTKDTVAVPLDVLLTKDTRLTVDRIIEVAVVAEEDVLLLEGEHLAHLKDVWLRIGPNHLTLVPADEPTHRALRSVWRKPRLIGVERIAIQRQERARPGAGG
jgi:hypothetical protein